MMNDTQPVENLEQNLKSLLEGLGDPRVAGVLSGVMLSDLGDFVTAALPGEFIETASESENFQGLPDKCLPDGDAAFGNQAQAIISWVNSEAGQFIEPLMASIASLVGKFVVSRRQAVISAMNEAGDGPIQDRRDRIVSASALINTATAIIERIDSEESIDRASEIMDEAVEKLEEAREILTLRVFDDAIMFGSSVNAGVNVPEDVPGLSPNGRRTDVENLLFDSWSVEVDGHVKLAGKVGPEIDGTTIVAEEQFEYLLDALIAIQDAYTIRPGPEVLLRFGQLRLAKGDIGEARMAAEKVMEFVPDEEDPICQAAISLYHDVENSSPLSRRDKRCFIATAAMDDIDAPEVDALRAFRDEVLMPSVVGRVLVRTYYRCSPPIASLIAEHAGLRRQVRRFAVEPMARVISGASISGK